jgi:hypothetical protein
MNPIDLRGTSNATCFSTNQTNNIYHRVGTIHPIADQLTSYDVQRKMKIPGWKQGKSTIAAGLGFPPFLMAKAGELVVQNCAHLALNAEKFSKNLGSVGQLLANICRMAIGVPVLFGGTLLFAGAVIFSKTQQIVWGKYLIENPLEQRFHPRLAWYGYGNSPWSDFRKLLSTFFVPSFNRESSADLNHWRNFNVT